MELSVQLKFDQYPHRAKQVLLLLRETIFEVAEYHGIDDLQETLKWGEPSYLSKKGSTVRFDWKSKYPDQFCIYFNCKTSLIDTFKELYGDVFIFEGKRALVFNLNADVPWEPLKHCLSLSLRYHKIKHLPLLGA
ncbi:hypothetical protein CW745_12755 [Psychromonas sp. psych-6C06]|uniref:DUF1801 domain-containing protein n=1 Tax=Psychromonas sp. psych-6C06 TaxID=2058089 RepID=UPI000C3494D7|nr:DUF1801 domain-containing protein [Psychromonas sp. psych-6C06]PKF60740.1 hypothetical protein CW745_12755 [Psychromonas sp. psych-6C06]